MRSSSSVSAGLGVGGLLASASTLPEDVFELEFDQRRQSVIGGQQEVDDTAAFDTSVELR